MTPGGQLPHAGYVAELVEELKDFGVAPTSWWLEGDTRPATVPVLTAVLARVPGRHLPGRARKIRHELSPGIDDDLRIHHARVVGAAVADAVALGAGAVDRDVIGIRLAKCPGQAGGAEAHGDLREGVVVAQVHQRDKRPLGGAELAAAVTPAGDDEHGDPLHERVQQVQCGRTGSHQSPRQQSCPPLPGRHPIGGHSEKLLTFLVGSFRSFVRLEHPGVRVWLKRLMPRVWLPLIGRPVPRDDSATHWDAR